MSLRDTKYRKYQSRLVPMVNRASSRLEVCRGWQRKRVSENILIDAHLKSLLGITSTLEDIGLKVSEAIKAINQGSL